VPEPEFSGFGIGDERKSGFVMGAGSPERDKST
jgi:hypothetical protein